MWWWWWRGVLLLPFFLVTRYTAILSSAIRLFYLSSYVTSLQHISICISLDVFSNLCTVFVSKSLKSHILYNKTLKKIIFVTFFCSGWKIPSVPFQSFWKLPTNYSNYFESSGVARMLQTEGRKYKLTMSCLIYYFTKKEQKILFHRLQAICTCLVSIWFGFQIQN